MYCVIHVGDSMGKYVIVWEQSDYDGKTIELHRDFESEEEAEQFIREHREHAREIHKWFRVLVKGKFGENCDEYVHDLGAYAEFYNRAKNHWDRESAIEGRHLALLKLKYLCGEEYADKYSYLLKGGVHR